MRQSIGKLLRLGATEVNPDLLHQRIRIQLELQRHRRNPGTFYIPPQADPKHQSSVLVVDDVPENIHELLERHATWSGRFHLDIVMARTPYFERLSALVREAGIGSRVRFLHNVEDADLEDLYRSCAAFPIRIAGQPIGHEIGRADEVAARETGFARLDRVGDGGAKQGAEERGFAAAVRPQQAEDFALAHFETDVRKRDAVAVAMGQILNLDHKPGLSKSISP